MGRYKVTAETPLVTDDELKRLVDDYVAAARLAAEVGFDFVDVKACHGYLLHEFLSPLSNQRNDAYGGPFENRIRALVEVVRSVRRRWPDRLPLFVRISATDWADGGWEIEQSVELARRLALLDVRPGRLLLGRACARREDPDRSRLPDAIRRANPPGGIGEAF